MMERLVVAHVFVVSVVGCTLHSVPVEDHWIGRSSDLLLQRAEQPSSRASNDRGNEVWAYARYEDLQVPRNEQMDYDAGFRRPGASAIDSVGGDIATGYVLYRFRCLRLFEVAAGVIVNAEAIGKQCSRVGFPYPSD
jgi:hypothetical protein